MQKLCTFTIFLSTVWFNFLASAVERQLEAPKNKSETELCLHNTDCTIGGFVCCKSHLCCNYEDYKNELKKCNNPGTNFGCGKGSRLVCCKNDSTCRLKEDCATDSKYIGNLKLLHLTEFQEAAMFNDESHAFHERLMAQHDSESTVLKLVISLLIVFVVALLTTGIGAGVYCVTVYYQRQSQSYMKLGNYGDDSLGGYQPYQFSSSPSSRKEGTI
ncbi:uncharacterized protein LOC142338278 isoform X2 [Convolutriloba macropyga]|uniref:uncharacterized protein LOC142338278 isoform X2 n=1 Tax=Convolutriloba macropyga TaxID=536237 RepID=UPI003F51DB6D